MASDNGLRPANSAISLTDCKATGTIALAAHHVVVSRARLDAMAQRQILVLIGLIEKGVNTWFDNGHMR